MKGRLGLCLLVLMPLAAWGSGTQHFDLEPSFVPAGKSGGSAAISVLFHALNAEVHINESPAPRLKLDPAQKVLADRQAPAAERSGALDPDKVKSLDLSQPVLFPVALLPDAPKGPQTVKATVSYYYCSKVQGWCRKGMTEVEVGVTVP